MNKKHIMIIGAGPVGQLLAISLHQSGIRPTLIGPKPSPLKNMVFAIHPSHMTFLKQMGITPETRPVQNMRLQTDYGEYYINARHAKRDALCHIVKYTDLLHHITTKRRQHDISWLQSTPTTYHNNTLVINEKNYTPDQIIACDGKHSWLRKQTNIQVNHYDYNQHAHTAIISHPHKQTDGYQRFDQFGTLAILPMPNPHQSALIWSCDPVIHQQIIHEGLKSMLQQHHSQTDKITSIQHHQYIPLSAILAQTYTSNRVILAGNALHTIHPLAGIGFNLAIGDIITLTETLLGNKPATHYQTRRRRAHMKAHWLTHLIAHSRHRASTYSTLFRYLKTGLTLNHVQLEMMRQLDNICIGD